MGFLAGASCTEQDIKKGSKHADPDVCTRDHLRVFLETERTGVTARPQYRHRRDPGFSLIETMIVLAIVGVVVASAIPSMQEWSSDARVKAASHSLARAFSFARSEAIRTANSHIVFFQNDTLGNSISGAFGFPIIVIDDDRIPASNCLIDGGDDVERLPGEVGVNWGVSVATNRVATDFGAGTFASGSSFADGNGTDTTWVVFDSRGMPAQFSTACVVGAAGTGAGAAYVSNGRRDYAVVVSPLGSVRIHSWNASAGAWTN